MKVVEKFVSINGEGKRVGQLAVFIRFAGCNLRCSYCDTMWANEESTEFEEMTKEQIQEYILSTGIKNVTITGGEPLIQESMYELLNDLSMNKNLFVEIETNGSVDLSKFMEIENRPSFTMDYKSDYSQMESKMYLENFNLLTKKDVVKFVSGSIKDLEKVKQLIEEFRLSEKTNVYISPVFGAIEPCDIVEWMTRNKLNEINLQLQLHKIIWEPQKKGV